MVDKDQLPMLLLLLLQHPLRKTVRWSIRFAKLFFAKMCFCSFIGLAAKTKKEKGWELSLASDK